MRTDEIYALMLTFHLQNIKKRRRENGKRETHMGISIDKEQETRVKSVSFSKHIHIFILTIFFPWLMLIIAVWCVCVRLSDPLWLFRSTGFLLDFLGVCIFFDILMFTFFLDVNVFLYFALSLCTKAFFYSAVVTSFAYIETYTIFVHVYMYLCDTSDVPKHQTNMNWNNTHSLALIHKFISNKIIVGIVVVDVTVVKCHLNKLFLKVAFFSFFVLFYF